MQTAVFGRGCLDEGIGMRERWRIVIGSDEPGLAYKTALKADLEAQSTVAEVLDVGVHTGRLNPYVSVPVAAARAVSEGRADRALLLCNSGLGAAIGANRVAGIRAVTAFDSPSVERSILDNDAQVLCFGHQVITLKVARRLAREWLAYRFDGAAATNVAVFKRREPKSGNDPWEQSAICRRGGASA